MRHQTDCVGVSRYFSFFLSTSRSLEDAEAVRCFCMPWYVGCRQLGELDSQATQHSNEIFHSEFAGATIRCFGNNTLSHCASEHCIHSISKSNLIWEQKANIFIPCQRYLIDSICCRGISHNSFNGLVVFSPPPQSSIYKKTLTVNYSFVQFSEFPIAPRPINYNRLCDRNSNPQYPCQKTNLFSFVVGSLAKQYIEPREEREREKERGKTCNINCHLHWLTIWNSTQQCVTL